MPAVAATLANDALSPILCVAEIWPCCADRGTYRRHCLEHTGCCVSLIILMFALHLCPQRPHLQVALIRLKAVTVSGKN